MQLKGAYSNILRSDLVDYRYSFYRWRNRLEAHSSISFYKNLQAFDKFEDVADSSRHSTVPVDWFIVIADIVGSTVAIKSGRYKDVNMIGAACIAAVCNIDKSFEFPFVFGGDGATFVVPKFYIQKVLETLGGVVEMASSSFNLKLRIGFVPVSRLVEDGFLMKMGKFKMSDFVNQPALSGRGWEEAERLVKAETEGNNFLLSRDHPSSEPDFSGLECRWKGVPSIRDCKLAILILCVDSHTDRHGAIYDSILELINNIFGDLTECRPVREDIMELSVGWKVIGREVEIKHSKAGLLKIWYHLATTFKTFLGKFILPYKIDIGKTEWSRYMSDFVANSDYRKFDGLLRMVIDATNDQKDALRLALSRYRDRGEIVFGTHSSPEAIVTCLVSSYNGYHTHFIDGSDGGYSMAAIELKEQLKQFKSDRQASTS
ncbi:MAG: DUF3095 family protein [Proteobacteria bacterium]|nr:DUF3095 family protein [Pseudomonadota bacterium]